MPSVGDWVQEKTSTIGQGVITLNGSDDNSLATFQKSFKSTVTNVWYSILDGDNRESGKGIFDGFNKLTRIDIDSTIENGFYNDTSPNPINLSGEAIVSCTFNSQAFRDLEAISSGNSQFKESSTNGVLSGGFATLVSGREINVAAGTGVIIDSYSDPLIPTSSDVSWASQSITLSNSGSSLMVSVYIDANGIVGQQNGILPPDFDRNVILISYVDVSYTDALLIDSRRKPNGLSNLLSDFEKFSLLGSQVKGMEVNPVNSALSIYIFGGSFFSAGINEENDIKSPNVANYPQLGNSSSPALFGVKFSSGSIFLVSTVIPKEAELSLGSAISLTGLEATIGYVYRSETGAVDYQLGTNIYNTAFDAIESLNRDRATHTRYAGSEKSILIAQVYVGNDAVDFSDKFKAGIVNILDDRPSSNSQPSVALKVQTDEIPMHLKNTLVSVGGWLGYALKDTDESPAPQELLRLEKSIDTTLSFVVVSSQPVVEMVHLYNILQDGFVKKLQLRVSVSDADTMSKVTIINETTGDEHFYSGPVLKGSEFTEVSVDAIFARKGDVIRVSFLLFNTPLNFIDRWFLERNNSLPVSGQLNINFLFNPTRLRFNNITANGDDRRPDLSAAQVGSVVTVAEEGHANRRLVARVNSINVGDPLTVDFLINQIYASSLPIRDGKALIVEVYNNAVVGARFNKINSFYDGTDGAKFANITSELYYNGVVQANVDDAYGISISYQPAYLSPDWLVLARGGI